MNFPGGGLPGGAGGRPQSGQLDMNDPNVKMMQSLMESCFAKTAMSGVAGFGLGGIFGMFMASMAYDTPFHTPPGTATTTAPTPAGGAAATAGKAATGAAAETAGKTAATAATTTASSATTTASSATTAATPVAATTAKPAASTAASTAAKSIPKSLPATSSSIAASTTAGAAATATLTGPAGAAATVDMATIASMPLRQQLAHGFRDMGSRSWSTAKNFGTVGALFSGIECGVEGLRAKNDMGNGVAAGCLTGAILARNAGPQAAAFGCAGFAAFSAAIDAYMRMPPSDD